MDDDYPKTKEGGGEERNAIREEQDKKKTTRTRYVTLASILTAT